MIDSRRLFAGGIMLVAAQYIAWRLWDVSVVVTRPGSAGPHAWCELATKTAEDFPQYEGHRYRGLRVALGGRRIAGYLGDDDVARLRAGPEDKGGVRTVKRYYMAQYASAPTVLVRGGVHQLVVVDCSTTEDAAALLSARNLVEIAELGEGLVLAEPAGGNMAIPQQMDIEGR